MIGPAEWVLDHHDVREVFIPDPPPHAPLSG